jgi:hypothetical protein
MLRMYSQALSERDVDVLDLRQLVSKDIGWTNGKLATSDGTAIYLPPFIEQFPTAARNFEYLKVILTQQAGHIEFGSFGFEFDRGSTRFRDLRPKLVRASDADRQGESKTFPTEISRFFGLFAHKRLACDIFVVVESARVEACVLSEYRGLASAYRSMRRRALALRPSMEILPAREALLEFMIRLSLRQTEGVKVPAQHVHEARAIGRLLRLVARRDATVEDAAEATARIYALVSEIANEKLAEAQFSLLKIEQDAAPSSSRSTRSSSSREWEEAEDFTRRWLSSDQSRRTRSSKELAYASPQEVDYRGDFKPELAQLLTRRRARSEDNRQSLSPEQIAEALASEQELRTEELVTEDRQQQRQADRRLQNLLRELARLDPQDSTGRQGFTPHWDDDSGPLSVTQPDSFVYDEWDFSSAGYRPRWCRVQQKLVAAGDLTVYRETLLHYAALIQRIRQEFEHLAPEIYHKEKRLPDGAEPDLDAAIEAMTDLRLGVGPSEKLFWRHKKTERDVAVAFLLDMSGSTGEAVGEPPVAAPVSGQTQSMLSASLAEPLKRQPRRIIDVEKEAIILMMDALETIGDRYGVYGFSGHGRENVEFYLIKDFDEEFSLDVAKRFGRIGPLHATRMGPAIRHATAKLREQPTRSKFLFLISDGRPQDRGYSQEGAEKAYAVQDTRMALIEARRGGIHSFCLTVDKEGNDYLRTMMDDFGYEVLTDVKSLPRRLPQLYKRLTT